MSTRDAVQFPPAESSIYLELQASLLVIWAEWTRACSKDRGLKPKLEIVATHIG